METKKKIYIILRCKTSLLFHHHFSTSLILSIIYIESECVCVSERERERECVCVCVCVRERERENFFLNFNNPLLQILFHNIIKLQYSFIRKTNPTHKCVKTKSPSKTEHKASL